MRVRGGPILVPMIDIRLKHVQRARGAAALSRVDQNGQVVAVEQCIRQIQTTDAEIDHGNLVGQRELGQLPGNLNPECIIAHEQITDAGNEDSLHELSSATSIRSSSSGRKKKR